MGMKSDKAEGQGINALSKPFEGVSSCSVGNRSAVVLDDENVHARQRNAVLAANDTVNLLRLKEGRAMYRDEDEARSDPAEHASTMHMGNHRPVPGCGERRCGACM